MNVTTMVPNVVPIAAVSTVETNLMVLEELEVKERKRTFLPVNLLLSVLNLAIIIPIRNTKGWREGMGNHPTKK